MPFWSRRPTSLPFEGPYILKPRFGGSSIGIDVVRDLATALARLSTNSTSRRGCVVEPFRADLTDVQVALRTYPELTCPPSRSRCDVPTAPRFSNYRDKYVGGEGMVSAPRELPAAPRTGPARLRRAERAHDRRGRSVRGVARVDFLWSESEFYVNEINTIPGSLSKHLFVDPPVLVRDTTD